jgi:hypothetical protein
VRLHPLKADGFLQLHTRRITWFSLCNCSRMSLMNKYSQRTRNLYTSNSEEPYKISRSGIELFVECPKCFYLDKKLGIKRPSGPSFSLNSAVDTLLKKEFDLLRQKGKAHELMKKYHVDAVPFKHPDLDIWRANFTGKQYLHPKTNLLITGAVDDVWIDPKDKLHIVDYKSTSTTEEISLEQDYKQGYKRQMEVYQWIFRNGGYKVSDTGYFVYANAGKNRPSFDGRLEFELSIIPYEGDDSWVEPVVFKIKKCLDSNKIPDHSPDCDFCQYRELIKKEE